MKINTRMSLYAKVITHVGSRQSAKAIFVLIVQLQFQAPDDVFRQLVLGSSGSEGGGSDVYALDADRAGYLQSIITSATPDVVQLIHARLPTL